MEALKSDFNECQEHTEYHQEKFKHVQAKLIDRIKKCKELNHKCVMIASQLAESREFKLKGMEGEAIKADLITKKDEIRALRTKLDKERDRMNQLTKRYEVSEKHKNQIDTNNITLNRKNCCL